MIFFLSIIKTIEKMKGIDFCTFVITHAAGFDNQMLRTR